MGDLLDEVGLHLRRLLGTGIGNHQLLVFLSQTLRCPMTEVHEEQQYQHEQADDEDHETGTVQLSLHANLIDLE